MKSKVCLSPVCAIDSDEFT